MAMSPRKLSANRQHSRQSTGPRTPEGKARFRLNAVRQGLLAKEVIVPVGDEQEKRAEFELLFDDLWQHYAPVGPVEEMLVEKIAIAYWRLRRATRAEVGELRLEFDRAAGYGAVVVFSGIAARLHTLVEKADPNCDFAGWLQTDTEMASLGIDVKGMLAHIKRLGPAEQKSCLLQVLEETRQVLLGRERAQGARQDRQREAMMGQRSLPTSKETVDSILRYEMT